MAVRRQLGYHPLGCTRTRSNDAVHLPQTLRYQQPFQLADHH